MAFVPTQTNGPINARALVAATYRNPALKAALELARSRYNKKFRPHLKRVEFLSHALTVGTLLLEQGADSDTLVAGILEDIVTVGGISLAQIGSQFGPVVAAHVAALTPVTVDGEIDFHAYGVALKAAGRAVQTVKLASMLDEVCALPSKALVVESVRLAQYQALQQFLSDGDAELNRRLAGALHRALMASA